MLEVTRSRGIDRDRAAPDFDSLAPQPGDFSRPRGKQESVVKAPARPSTAETSASPRRPSFFRKLTGGKEKKPKASTLAPPLPGLAPSRSSSSAETPSLSRSHLTSSSLDGAAEADSRRASTIVAEFYTPDSSPPQTRHRPVSENTQDLRSKASDWTLYLRAIGEEEQSKKPMFPSIGIREPAPRMSPQTAPPLSVLAGTADVPQRQSTRLSPTKPRGPVTPSHRTVQSYAEPAGLAPSLMPRLAAAEPAYTQRIEDGRSLPRMRDSINAPAPQPSRSQSVSPSTLEPRRGYRDEFSGSSEDVRAAAREEQRASRELRQRVSSNDIRRRIEEQHRAEQSKQPRREEPPRRISERELFNGVLPGEEAAASRSIPREVVMNSVVGLPPPPGVVAHARRDEEESRRPPRLPLPEPPRAGRSHPLAEAQAQTRHSQSPPPLHTARSGPPGAALRYSSGAQHSSSPASAGPSGSRSLPNGPPEPHPLAKRGPAHASTSRLDTTTAEPAASFAALSSFAPPPPSALDGVKLADIEGPNAAAYTSSSSSLQVARMEDMKRLNKLNTSGPRVMPPSRRSPLSMAVMTGAGARAAVTSYGAQIKSRPPAKLRKGVDAPMERPRRERPADAAVVERDQAQAF